MLPVLNSESCEFKNCNGLQPQDFPGFLRTIAPSIEDADLVNHQGCAGGNIMDQELPTTPKSFEILRSAVDRVGTKSVAKDLRLSPSLIYKWCEAYGEDDSSGSENPLDRILSLVRATGDRGPIEWLCQNLNGYFVSNPEPEKPCNSPQSVMVATQNLLKEFTDVLGAVSQSLQNDNVIDQMEAKKIRCEWEELKALAEAFVRSCERGRFS
jgi:hypothetical protein